MSPEQSPEQNIELDLAFQTGPDLDPALLGAAAGFADPLTGGEAWSALLGCWLSELQEELPGPLRSPAYSLGLSLVSDAEIAELNQDWRQINGPTDVLAFAAQEAFPMPLPPEPGGLELCPLELGDIVISLDTAARQAPDHGHSIRREIQFLASHGLLHLLGWDHPDETSLAAMLERQNRLLAATG